MLKEPSASVRTFVETNVVPLRLSVTFHSTPGVCLAMSTP
jgi:hypothetical protein